MAGIQVVNAGGKAGFAAPWYGGVPLPEIDPQT